jgi:tetratricopeptide (TPR) repeat protein
LHKPFSLTSQGFDILWENYQEDQNNIPAIETHGKESLGRNHVSVAKLKHISAPMLDAKGDHVDAEKVMRDLQETFKQDYHEMIATDLTLANCLQHRGMLRQAEELLNSASEKLERKYGKNKGFMVARLKTIQGEVFQKQGRYELAEKTYREALECDQGLLGSETETSLQLRTSFALCLLHQNKLQEAETMFKDVAAVCKRRLGEGHLATKRTLRWLADAPCSFITGSMPIPKKHTAIFSSTLDNSLDNITWKR